MINPTFHKQEDKNKFISPAGFVGSTQCIKKNGEYTTGENPYSMVSLNPQFVRVSKGEDSPDPKDPLHI